MFLSTLSVALCLFLTCSTLRSDAEGIQLQDRLYRIPIKKDIWDAGKRRADARNGMIMPVPAGENPLSPRISLTSFLNRTIRL